MKIIKNTSVKKVIVSSVSGSMPAVLKFGYNITRDEVKLHKKKTIKWNKFFEGGHETINWTLAADGLCCNIACRNIVAFFI